MRLRPVRTDRLSLSLLQPQLVDEGGAEQKNEDERGDHRAAGAKGDVAKDVEDGKGIGQVDQPVQHEISPALAPVSALR